MQAVFERLVDIICDKMSESLDSDPNMVNSSKGTRLTDQTPAPNAGACQCWGAILWDLLVDINREEDNNYQNNYKHDEQTLFCHLIESNTTFLGELICFLFSYFPIF